MFTKPAPHRTLKVILYYEEKDEHNPEVMGNKQKHTRRVKQKRYKKTI